MADVLALVDDLFFQSKLAETARHVGVTLQTVTTGNALTEAASTNVPRLVLVDLNARAGAIEAVERMCALQKNDKRDESSSLGHENLDTHQQNNGIGGYAHLPVIAFLSHVQTELAERARAAGCTNVLPRSKFTAELAQILRQAKT
jgi:CheY-like chemotaxis protein